jgi:hypothetical protein
MQTVYVSATANVDKEIVFALLVSGIGTPATVATTFASGELQFRPPSGVFATAAGSAEYVSAAGNQVATGIIRYLPSESELATAGTGVIFVSKPNYQPVWERVQIRQAMTDDPPLPAFVAKDSTAAVLFRVRNLRGAWDNTTAVSAGDLFITVSAASAAVAGGTVTNLGSTIPGLRSYALTGAETVAEGKLTIRMRRAGVTSGGADVEVAVPLSLTSAGVINSNIVSQTSAAVIDVNIFGINDVTVSGVGTSANPWGPA